MTDVYEHLHSVASINIPVESIKPTSTWVAIVHHTKARDLKSVCKTADFLWFKCQPNICVRTLKSQYFTRHFIEDVRFYLGNHEPDDLCQVEDLHKHNSFGGKVIVLRAVDPDAVVYTRDNHVKREESEDIMTDNQLMREFKYGSGNDHGRDKDHAIAIADEEDESGSANDADSGAMTEVSAIDADSKSDTGSSGQSAASDGATTPETEVNDMEEEGSTFPSEKRKFAAAFGSSECPSSGPVEEDSNRVHHMQTAPDTLNSTLESENLTSGSKCLEMVDTEEMELRADSADMADIVYTVSEPDLPDPGTTPHISTNTTESLEPIEFQYPTPTVSPLIFTSGAENYVQDLTRVQPSVDLGFNIDDVAYVNPCDLFNESDTATSIYMDASSEFVPEHGPEAFFTPFETAEESQQKIDDAAWMQRIEANRAEEDQEEEEAAELEAERELETLVERDEQMAEAMDADWGCDANNDSDCNE